MMTASSPLRPFCALLTRELRVLFFTPIAWGALGAFALITALLFWLELVSFEVAQQRALTLNDQTLLRLLDFNTLLIGSVLNHAQLLLLFLVPIFTMRLFADEARQGTLDLLLAAPVRTSTIVLAKLAGVSCVLFALGAVLLAYPALLQVFGRAVVQGDGVVDWAQAGLGIAAVVATGTLYGAIGASISAAMESPSSAALLTVLALVGLWFAGSAAQGLEGVTGAAVAWLAPMTHMERLGRGVLTVADVTYFSTFTAAFGFITQRLLEARRRMWW